MTKIEEFKIVSRTGPNEKTEVAFTGTYEQAGREASRIAKEIDAEHGDGYWWSVDLYSVEHPEYGSYFQLFHGRTS